MHQVILLLEKDAQGEIMMTKVLDVAVVSLIGEHVPPYLLWILVLI